MKSEKEAGRRRKEERKGRTYRRILEDNMLFSSLMGRGLRNLVMRLLVRFWYQLRSCILDNSEALNKLLRITDSGLTNTNLIESEPPIPLPTAHLGNIKPQTA
jgi:hypothetical protein